MVRVGCSCWVVMSGKKRKREQDSWCQVEMIDNMVVARGLLSEKEQVDLYEKIQAVADYPFGKDKDMFFNKYLSQGMSEDQKDIYDQLMYYYNSIVEQLEDGDESRNKRIVKEIKNMYNDEVAMLAIKYNSKDSMEPHLDQWSTWNMIVCLGGEADMVYYKNKKLKLQGGDVYIFNGNKKKHSVNIIENDNNVKWKKCVGESPYRVCIQLRKVLAEQ